MSTRYRLQYIFDSDPHPTFGPDYMTTIKIVDTQTGNIVGTSEGYSKQDSTGATRDARVAAFAWIIEREKQDAGQMTSALKGDTDGE